MPRTLRSLTGLRAVAAGLVFLRHAEYIFDRTTVHRWTWRLFVQGGVGVSFFFVLSGFVLTWSWRPGAIQFYRRRFARIYPAYFASTVMAGGVVLLIGGAASVAAVFSTVFLVQSWTPNQAVSIAFDGVTWSLSCEAFFYLLFPLLVVIAARASVVARRLLLLAVIGATLAIPTFVTPTTITTRFWLTYIFPPSRLPEFACGILLALEVKSGRWPRVPLWFAWPFALAGYLAAGEAGLWRPGFTTYQGYAATTIIPFLILIGAYATRDVSGKRTRMGSPALVRLGEISFAFYLVHLLVIQVFMHYTPNWRPSLAEAIFTVGALFVAAFAAAWLLYVLVERPAERKLRPTSERPEAVLADVEGGLAPSIS